MAVYQPRRAAIATILVTVMQDDICEEFLGRHKRGRTKEWIRRIDEKGMYRLVEELRAEELDFFRFFRFSHFLAFSVTVVRIFVQIIALLFFTGRWRWGSQIALSPPWLPPLTEKLSCTIIDHRSSARSNGKKTIMNYHVEFEHVQTAW